MCEHTCNLLIFSDRQCCHAVLLLTNSLFTWWREEGSRTKKISKCWTQVLYFRCAYKNECWKKCQWKPPALKVLSIIQIVFFKEFSNVFLPVSTWILLLTKLYLFWLNVKVRLSDEQKQYPFKNSAVLNIV